MKKTLLFLLFIFSLFGFFRREVNAETFDTSWNFFPLGINYLNPNFFVKEYDAGEYVFTGVEPFRVAPSVSYSLHALYPDNLYDEVELFFYNKDRSLTETLIIEETSTNLFEFVIPSNCFFLKINISFYNGMISGPDEIDDIFVLCEGDKILSGELKYIGFNNEYTFIDTNDIYYITNVNNPISSSDIKSAVVAFDNYDGNVTESITFNTTEYDINKDTVGVYKITATVVDKNHNSSYLNIHIAVCDYDSPVISGRDTFEINYTTPLSIDEVILMLSVSDNYDELSSEDIYVISSDYPEDDIFIGSYEVIVGVKDSSKNEGIFEFTIKVKDDVPPVFTCSQDVITTGTKNVLSINEIKTLVDLSCYDDYSGNLTNSIFEYENTYANFENKIGAYYIIFGVRDDEGNLMTKKIIINVEDDIAPIFAVDERVFDLEIGSNYNSPEDFVVVLQRLSIIDEMSTYEVIYDDYSGNSSKEGKYKMVLRIDNKDYKLSINVRPKDEIKTPLKVSFFKRVGVFFKGIFGKVGTFFVNVYEKVVSFFSRVFDDVSSFFRK